MKMNWFGLLIICCMYALWLLCPILQWCVVLHTEQKSICLPVWLIIDSEFICHFYGAIRLIGLPQWAETHLHITKSILALERCDWTDVLWGTKFQHTVTNLDFYPKKSFMIRNLCVVKMNWNRVSGEKMNFLTKMDILPHCVPPGIED